MRIVIDLQTCQTGSRARGMGRYSRSLAQAICRNPEGHEIWIALSGFFPEVTEDIKQAFAGLLPKNRIVLWQAVSPVAAKDCENGWRQATGEILREHALKALKPDAIHVASLFEGLGEDALTSIPPPSHDLVTAVTLYDLIPLVHQELYLDSPVAKDWYFNKLQHLNAAQLAFGISDHSCREGIDLLGLPREKVFNISAAVEGVFKPAVLSHQAIASLKERLGLKNPFVMYAGGIEPRKNVERLIEAYATLPPPVRSGHQLAIVCSVAEADRARLLSLARSRNLDPRQVVFTDYVSDEDLVALYSICKCFVFPSWHEGFGLPVLEAMSCGAPTIGSGVASIPEVIGREDALFDPYNVSSIAAKLCEALTNDAFREDLRDHALRQSKRFTWERSARAALAAFEQARGELTSHRGSPVPAVVRSPKPVLAYVSPLPPERTGIATYSAELLPELAKYYDIELVVNQEKVTDPWALAHCPIRTAEWFRSHAHTYSRIIYQFGNSVFHSHMFNLLRAHPGTVVLHDFYLSGIHAHRDLSGEIPGTWTDALYYSHGYQGVRDRCVDVGLADLIYKYPCNKQVLDHANGVIVHSEHSRSLADIWYGAGASHDWIVIPHARAKSDLQRRERERGKLGLAAGDWLLCSFGQIDPTKMTSRLLDCWLNSSLGRDAACRLVFVGSNSEGAYGASLLQKIEETGLSDRIHITGYLEKEDFDSYLAACDAAVQLRTNSRGETSGTLLDCLAHGVPLVINAHGSAAEIPNDAAARLPDAFSDLELISSIEELRHDPERARILRERALEYIATRHDPPACARLYYDAIERFATDGPQAVVGRVAWTLSLRSALSSYCPTTADIANVAECIAANRKPLGGVRQLIVDVTELATENLRTGIQRTQSALLKQILSAPPDGFRVEPVYAKNDGYYYARTFGLSFLNLAADTLSDEPLEFSAGDVLLGLDWGVNSIPPLTGYLEKMRNRGVMVVFLVYDLLPILLPNCFPEYLGGLFSSWLEAITVYADGIVCISRSVADELVEWLKTSRVTRPAPLSIGFFHLGADLEAGFWDSHANGSSVDGQPELDPTGKSFLMVSTIEPRKGHDQVLAAFEQLWKDRTDVNLLLVGKEGHGVGPLMRKIRAHSLLDKRLFWFEAASDHVLLRLYSKASALIAASLGEGFGLPLVEAARHGLPIIARDIPVFREVAGGHAFYFAGDNSKGLAKGIKEWLTLEAQGRAPLSEGMPRLTWAQSTGSLLGVVLRDQWYKTWKV